MPSRLPVISAAYRGVLLVAGLVLVSGCGLLRGSDGIRPNATEFYNRYLPTTRDIPHPDHSNEDAAEMTMRQLRTQWSSSHTQRFGRRNFAPSGFSSFATLWGRDLATRSAEVGLGISDLSPDLQERARTEQRERYERTLAFEVHLFVPATQNYSVTDTDLRTAGVSIVLQDDRRNEYRPVRVETGLPEEHAMMTSQSPVYYRTNQIYFDRFQDDRDILEGVESLRLIVRTSGITPDEIWFAWRIRPDA
jgi:hypothetical protein